MQRTIFQFFFVLIFCFAFACKSNKSIVTKSPYILSNSADIQELEEQDHKFCDSLDLDSGSSNKGSRGNLYWHCRLSMAKYKLHSTDYSPSATSFNSKITQLIAKISLNLSGTNESAFTKENKKLDARQHAKCVEMGFDFDMNDRSKTDQYLLCRKRLIDDQDLDPPYGNSDYLKYPNRSYNLDFVIDNRIDQSSKKRQEAEKNYPTCVKFFPKESNFKKCTEAQDQSKRCFAELEGKKLKKEAEQKTLCQKQSYIRFPDSFLKDVDQKRQDIERAKINADLYNNNTFSALGIIDDDVELFESDETADAEEDAREAKKQQEKNINSKRGLYSRYELTKLRQRYIIACQQNADTDLAKYAESLKKTCEDAAKFEVKEDLF